MSNKALGIATQVLLMAIVISVVILFAGIVVLVLVHVCIVGRALRRGLVGAGNQANNNIESGISHDDLERIPSFSFKGLDKGSSPVNCAVCLEHFESGEMCRMLPMCKHSFHAQCVDMWLLTTPLCPICRSRADSFERLESGPCDHQGEVEMEVRERQEIVAENPANPGNSPVSNLAPTS